MDEEQLHEFQAAAPPPGLKERILEAARTAPRPGLIDRLWTRQTWLALAAAFLAALGLYGYSASSLRFDPAGAVSEVERAFAVTHQVIQREHDAKVLTVLEARARVTTLLEGGSY